MAAQVEIFVYEGGKHDRRIIALEPQEDGTQSAIAVPTDFGPLSIVLGEPVAEPAPTPEKKPAAKA